MLCDCSVKVVVECFAFTIGFISLFNVCAHFYVYTLIVKGYTMSVFSEGLINTLVCLLDANSPPPPAALAVLELIHCIDQAGIELRKEPITSAS